MVGHEDFIDKQPKGFSWPDVSCDKAAQVPLQRLSPVVPEALNRIPEELLLVAQSTYSPTELLEWLLQYTTRFIERIRDNAEV